MDPIPLLDQGTTVPLARDIPTDHDVAREDTDDLRAQIMDDALNLAWQTGQSQTYRRLVAEVMIGSGTDGLDKLVSQQVGKPLPDLADYDAECQVCFTIFCLYLGRGQQWRGACGAFM